MADPQYFEISAEHPLTTPTQSKADLENTLRYMQPSAGSSMAAMITAWADSAAGVIAKTGVNTSESIGYETLRQRIENNTAYQTLTGAGTVTVTEHVTYLSATSGTYTLAINVGSYDGQEKIIILVNNVTTAVFNMPAGYLDWNTLTFKQGCRVAVLRWVGGAIAKWVLAGGNVEVS